MPHPPPPPQPQETFNLDDYRKQPRAPTPEDHRALLVAFMECGADMSVEELAAAVQTLRLSARARRAGQPALNHVERGVDHDGQVRVAACRDEGFGDDGRPRQLR